MKTSLLPAGTCAGSWRCFIGLVVAIILGGWDCSPHVRCAAEAAETLPTVATGTATGKSDTPSAAPVLSANPLAGSAGPAITGRVRLRGTPPPERDLSHFLDPACKAARDGRPLSTRFFVVGTKAGLADVFVCLRGEFAGQKYPPPAEPVLLKTEGCQFQPYVTAAQTRQVIVVRNSESPRHEPISNSVNNRDSGRAPVLIGPEAKFVFAQPELFLRFKCDVHPWMFAYVCVVEHPFFAVTDTNGVFRIPLPPPGRYEIEAVHRRAGKSVQIIEVEAGKELKLEFTLDLSP